MANFCLIPAEIDKFKAALVSGKINPPELAKMTSAERHAFFEDIVGKDNAKGVNALFESKLLLKNQQKGMVSWAKKVSGITEETRRDMIARIQRLDQVLDPSEEKAFLADLAETKLGVSVTPTEAKTISNLAKKVEETEAAIDRSSKIKSASRMAYGRARVDLENYVLDKKQQAQKMKAGDYLKHPGKTTTLAAGQAKAINASMDNSAIFRQGWKTMITNPIMWQRNARKTFVDAVRQFGNKPVMDELRADILSRENSLNGNYTKMKLDIGTLEEPFPTHLPEKVPLLGRLYHASESAYTGLVYRQRADIADKYLEIANKTGVNMKDAQELKSIGKLVNSLTGRGDLGTFERVAQPINNIFFSPRFLKSNVDFLTAHQLQKGVTPFVRKRAAMNLLKVVSATAGILAIADMVKPGSVEWDPRSADFGHIRIGNTRFDVTGGMASVVTLASRLLPSNGNEGIGFYSKSSTTKQVNKLNSGKYGSQTVMDVIDSFFQNKLAPATGVVRDFAKGQDFKGNTVDIRDPKSWGREGANLITPLSVSNYNELKSDPHSANTLAAMIADGLGIVTNTYGKSQTNWNRKTSKELTAFKKRVGQDKFNKANQDYNKRLDNFMQQLTSNPKYKNMPTDRKQALLTQAKTKLQKDVLKDYGFKYHAPKTSQAKNNKSFLKSLGI